MYVLGIETTCDETGASVVQNGQDILSQVVSSSLKDHQKFGGIIPEIASRRQLELIQPVVKQALEQSGRKLNTIDALAVAVNPGLIGSLLVGTSFARALSFAIYKPLVEVDHIKAHLYANFLRAQPRACQPGPAQPLPTLPAIGLIVSGGHTSLYEIRDFSDFKLLGQTRDDAAGEAFDKVARILDLGYPGGPVIDKYAQEVEPGQLRFPCAKMEGSYDFSFSGTKTAVLYHWQKNPASDKRVVARAFQDSVVSILVSKSIAACHEKNIQTLLIGGGVAANSSLRETLSRLAQEQGVRVFFPDLSLCMDNAAMIAGYGYHQIS